ncbi:hypothetical protein [Enorma massiliensis]|uniref:hypothetical protein n=1 Tax=Enorma massiliensis TaxID=1472761 RepID=UPI003AB62616
MRATSFAMAAVSVAFACVLGLSGCDAGGSGTGTNQGVLEDEAEGGVTEDEGYTDDTYEDSYDDSSDDTDYSATSSTGAGGIDVSAVTDWSVPPAEVQALVDNVNQAYGLELEFVTSSDSDYSGTCRWYFQDEEAQQARDGGDSLSIEVDVATGQYSAAGLYCLDADDALGTAAMVAEEFRYDDFPLEELTQIFHNPDAGEGSVLEYYPSSEFEYAYSKQDGIFFIGIG